MIKKVHSMEQTINYENVVKHCCQLLKVVNKINCLHAITTETLLNYDPFNERVVDTPKTNVSDVLRDHKNAIAKCDLSFMNSDSFVLIVDGHVVMCGKIAQIALNLVEQMSRNGCFIWMMHYIIIQLMLDYEQDKTIRHSLKLCMESINTRIRIETNDGPFDVMFDMINKVMGSYLPKGIGIATIKNEVKSMLKDDAMIESISNLIKTSAPCGDKKNDKTYGKATKELGKIAEMISKQMAESCNDKDEDDEQSKIDEEDDVLQSREHENKDYDIICSNFD